MPPRSTVLEISISDTLYRFHLFYEFIWSFRVLYRQPDHRSCKCWEPRTHFQIPTSGECLSVQIQNNTAEPRTSIILLCAEQWAFWMSVLRENVIYYRSILGRSLAHIISSQRNEVFKIILLFNDFLASALHKLSNKNFYVTLKYPRGKVKNDERTKMFSFNSKINLWQILLVYL